MLTIFKDDNCLSFSYLASYTEETQLRKLIWKKKDISSKITIKETLLKEIKPAIIFLESCQSLPLFTAIFSGSILVSRLLPQSRMLHHTDPIALLPCGSWPLDRSVLAHFVHRSLWNILLYVSCMHGNWKNLFLVLFFNFLVSKFTFPVNDISLVSYRIKRDDNGLKFIALSWHVINRSIGEDGIIIYM